MGMQLDAFNASVEACLQQELKPDLDASLIASGRAIAARIDYVKEHEDEFSSTDFTKALYLLPHLQSILKEMLATPAARAAADKKPTQEGGKLKRLRAATEAAAKLPPAS